jgi:phospholipase D1/2
MSFMFDKLHKTIHEIGNDLKDSFAAKNDASAQAQQEGAQPGQEYHNQHRFLSFAPERHGNDIKWYVDGECILSSSYPAVVLPR